MVDEKIVQEEKEVVGVGVAVAAQASKFELFHLQGRVADQLAEGHQYLILDPRVLK